MQQEKKLNYPSNAFGRFWMKLPLVLRSILLGSGISFIGIGIWVLMVTIAPGPWSMVSMAVILVIYWLYFSGKWNPSNTRAYRQFCMRQVKLNRSVWIWGLVAAFLLILSLNSGLVHTFRMIEFQPEMFKTARYLNDLPAWAAWSIILMASLVAGICEEVGFRGYMQKPLEQKYGPVIGISITSLVFVLVHLHQAWASGILVHIFIISSMIGYLAYSTNSLLPGIIAHVTFDIINFSYWWSDVMGNFELKPIGVTGVDNHFIITSLVVLLSLVLFIVAIHKLLKMKIKESVG
jgi:membrane protease YdiL (CAAX protease family)